MWKIHQWSEQNKPLDGFLVTFALLFENELRRRREVFGLDYFSFQNKSTLYCQIEIKSKMFCSDISKKIYIKIFLFLSFQSKSCIWILTLLLKIYSFETWIKVHKSKLNLVAQSCGYFSNQSWCKTQQRPLKFSLLPLHDILQLRSRLLHKVSTVFQSVHFPYYGIISLNRSRGHLRTTKKHWQK